MNMAGWWNGLHTALKKRLRKVEGSNPSPATMNKYLEMLLIALGTIIVSIPAALISNKIRNKEVGIWAYFVAGNCTLFLWTMISKYSTLKLVFASFLFDTVMAVTWAMVLIFFGDELTSRQLVGIFVMLAGLVVFNS